MKKLHTVNDVVKAIGGRKAVAELTGVTRKAVYVWVDQSAFPSKIYMVLKEALAKHGYEADVSLFSFSAPSEGKADETHSAA
jgi:hypothetical protein